MSLDDTYRLDEHYRQCGPVVLRTPLLPFDEIETWGDGLKSDDQPGSGAGDGDDGGALEEALAHDRELLRGRLRQLLERPEIAEAVFLASPELVRSLGQWRRDPESKKGRRSEQGLVRYLLRMASRPTPFGLFAGCTPGSVAQDSEASRLALVPRSAYRRHSRLDMDYLFALCEHLGRDAAVREAVRLRPNSSLYASGGRLRYAEARLAGRLRTYHLVAVEAFEALELILERAADPAEGGARLGDLAAALVAADPDGEITLEEAREFLDEVVDNQILVPDLALEVTGEESTPGLLRQLAELGVEGEAEQRLERSRRALAAIDAGGVSAPTVGSPTDRYQEIATDLEPLGVPVEMSRLFQVDLVKPGAEVKLAPEVVDEILRGVGLLYRLGPAWRDSRIEDFSSAFRERYGEGREVPLLDALDEERGLGFERSNQAGAEASPLLSGLPMLPRGDRRTIPWAEREALLLRRLSETLLAGEAEMVIGNADVEALDGVERPPLPDAFHTMVSLAASSPEGLAEGDFRLLLAHAAGPSGARLLGRFCHTDEAIRTGVEEHLAAEEALAPDAVFAEIVHLPEGRIGNILARPLLRRFEIPFLGHSGAPGGQQLPAQDLLITVSGERVRLRSKSLGREVIPRLTNAHNTSRSSLGLYRFLAALQAQGRTGGVSWIWGPLEAAPFLPRVTSGRIVFACARWRVSASEIRPLARASGAKRWRLAQRWRHERHMPRLVALADGDNELLLDFRNPLSLDAVVEVIKNREEAVLTEVFPGPDELCAEGPEGRFFHELVVPFVRRPKEPAEDAALARATAPAPSDGPSGSVERTPLPRILPPGAGWLFAKLYSGTASADRMLRDEVAPLARWTIETGAAQSWFFMRYGDPLWHLRVRFRGDPGRLREEVQPRLEEVFARLLDSGTAWKAQLDTYEREMERYGGEAGMELSEELFFHDSEAVVALLEWCSGDAGADLRWRLALLGMDRLLADFGLDLEARLALAEPARDGFARRYRYEELLRTPVADRLRQERASLQRLLAFDLETADEEYRPGLAILARRSHAIAPIVQELQERDRRGELTTPLARIVPSYVHMFVNRLSRSAGPEHELVLYDFLVQLYRSQIARERAQSRKKGERGGKRAAAKG